MSLGHLFNHIEAESVITATLSFERRHIQHYVNRWFVRFVREWSGGLRPCPTRGPARYCGWRMAQLAEGIRFLCPRWEWPGVEEWPAEYMDRVVNHLRSRGFKEWTKPSEMVYRHGTPPEFNNAVPEPF